MKKLIYLMGCLIAVLMASCSSDEPQIVDDTQTEPETQHVSKADFERLVEGKIWCIATEIGKWVGDITYVAISDDSVYETDINPLTGMWRNTLGLVMTNGKGYMLQYRTPGDPATYPLYYTTEYTYEYDETTGMINFRRDDKLAKCIFLEKASEDEIVIHTDFGIMKKYYIEWVDENGKLQCQEKESNESYAREVYKAVSIEDIANSWGSLLGGE